MTGGRRVWREADVLWEVELFWDLRRAWPTCLKGLHERPSCFGTYRGLGRRIWMDWMRAQRVLILMEGLVNMFDGRPTCYGRSSCYETYEGLGRRVWRGWMGGRLVIGPIKGLADVFEGTAWEAELFWDLWRASPTCSETYGGLRRRVEGVR